MRVSFWINAFIPRDVPNYTRRVERGTNAGKTAIPLPGAARLNPFNWKDWDAGYLTDQRSFSSMPTASVRMRSIASVDVSRTSGRVVTCRHETSGTTEVDMDTGETLG